MIKKFTDIQVKEVGKVTALPEMSVNMPFVIGEKKVELPVTISAYYVTFTAYDEWSSVPCIVKGQSLSDICNVQETLEKHAESREPFGAIKCVEENGIMSVNEIHTYIYRF